MDRTRLRIFTTLAAAGFALVPLVSQAAVPEAVPDTDDPTPIFGGDDVQSCGWPTTVSMQGECTGTLVHPQLVIYAAHCGTNYSSVEFGEQITPGHARSVPTERCEAYPSFELGAGTDWAFCVLQEPQNDIAITPPLMGCEVDVLQPGTEVTIVGYGQSENGYGDKKEVTTQFNQFEGNEAFIGGGGEDSCGGDSGGPVYVRMPDGGSWRAFGITSYGSECGSGGYYSLMHTGMDWFETQSGIDLTPCHDAQGNWDPTPDCTGFPMAPGTSGGSWNDGCAPGDLSGPESTCGAPFDTSSDMDPPIVTFVSPADEARFDSDPGSGTASVMVEISADDGDGFGVDTVELLVDGMSIDGGVSQSAPHTYTLSLPPGAYALDAIAVDQAGNEGEAETLYIGVDMDAEPSGDEGSGDGVETADGTAGDDLPGGTAGDDGASSGETAGGVDGGDDGCGCRSASPSPWSAMFGLFGLMALRRRRR
ncbi:MAG: trypsin-like serine protease [Myxococcota bacterium]